MYYKHLTQEERYHIYEGKTIRKSLRKIAKELKRDVSTLSRETRRNKGERGYRPCQAHRLASERKSRCVNGRQVDQQVWDAAQLCFKEKWSPEQIAGRFKLLNIGRISHESIYQRLLQDKKNGGTLYQNLRCQKKRRKRYGSGCDRRGQIIGRLSINKRPSIVNQKSRLGDWEADTIIGATHQQAIISVVERTTQLVLLKKEKEIFYNYSTRGFLCGTKTKFSTEKTTGL